MAKYRRRQELVKQTDAYKWFNTRYCDLNKTQKRLYLARKKEQSRIRQREQLNKEA